ncbi:hypothetical protein [Salinibacillus xinjiangensis]|uniref:Uncharacterized protein n=1 Tax=Salinibacillus xinjiangensis TaxID=1229268 RepID=A0A6G1X8C2_9BACI|nr:hypothetical protein [Salinibacillus xinjiangensis]MRG87156.1 hypothetical protein [Salinibacillus xinjiangensis]
MKKKSKFEKQMENLKEETDNPAVLNDVVDTEFEQYPGHNESLVDDDRLTPFQEIVRDNSDGKKWAELDEDE